MRLTTQIVLGHLGLVLALVVLSALGITILQRVSRDGALVLSEIELAKSRLRPASTEASLEPVESRARAAHVHLEKATAAAAGPARMTTSGIGLVAAVGAVSLVLALYFGYWLANAITQPIERLGRGIDLAIAGDRARRFGAQARGGVVSEIAVGLDMLLDRLQRAESAPRADLLLACAAFERLCEAEPRAVALIAGSRLLASNARARSLVLERGASFSWLIGEARRLRPDKVEVVDLEGPGGEGAGALVWISPEAVEPSGPPKVV